MIFLKDAAWFNSHGLGDCSGYAWPAEGIAVVRADISKDRRAFVAYHEDYHLGDHESNELLRELKADMAAAVRHPRGAVKELADMLMSHARREHYEALFKRALDKASIDIDIQVPVIRVRW